MKEAEAMTVDKEFQQYFETGCFLRYSGMVQRIVTGVSAHGRPALSGLFPGIAGVFIEYGAP